MPAPRIATRLPLPDPGFSAGGAAYAVGVTSNPAMFRAE